MEYAKIKKHVFAYFSSSIEIFCQNEKYSRGAGGQVFRNLWTTHGMQYHYILYITSL